MVVTDVEKNDQIRVAEKQHKRHFFLGGAENEIDESWINHGMRNFSRQQWEVKVNKLIGMNYYVLLKMA